VLVPAGGSLRLTPCTRSVLAAGGFTPSPEEWAAICKENDQFYP
jgi:hypothetical protein